MKKIKDTWKKINYVSKTLSKEGLFGNERNSFFKSDNYENNEFWESLNDLFTLTNGWFNVANAIVSKWVIF